MSPSARKLSKKDFESLSEFRYQMRRFERFSERAAQGEGLTPQQYLVLLHIKGVPGREWASVGEIAERLQLQPHGAVALVTRCEALELVARRPSDTDRRQVEVHLLPVPTRADSDAMVARIEARIADNGWGFWAVEHKDSGEFTGFTGLNVPLATLPFSPCVEIGWRFAREWWGQGLASEAARGALQVGFDRLGLDEIVAFTAAGNFRSAAVMNRIGMHQDVAGAFDHPLVPEGHALQHHRLYRIGRAAWAASRNASE